MKDKANIKVIQLKCDSATCQGKLTDHKVREYTFDIEYKCTQCTWVYTEPKEKK